MATAVRREDCDAGRAAIAAINDKTDGAFDNLLPNTQLSVTVAFYDSARCGDPHHSAVDALGELLVQPVAIIGPSTDTCLKSVNPTLHLPIFGAQSVMLSEASAATGLGDLVRDWSASRAPSGCATRLSQPLRRTTAGETLQ